MTQFHRLRFLPALFLLFICVTPCVSAFAVSSTSVNPQGYQAPGTPMTVNFSLDFFPKGNATFPQAGELHMSTDLVDSRWVPVLILDGVETHLPQGTGDSQVIAGFYLSYPSTQHVQMRVTLNGVIPASPSPGRNFFNIQETDSDKNVVTSAHLAMPETPLVPPSPRSTPSRKPTTKKIFTPIPTETPTQESPVGPGAGIIAITGGAFLAVKRK
jgi:hypothetical protein